MSKTRFRDHRDRDWDRPTSGFFRDRTEIRIRALEGQFDFQATQVNGSCGVNGK